jgi:hypothetical protein
MPRGSMMKYFSDQGGDRHGGPLHWPGTADGFPFRGDNIPNLKQHEMEQLPHVLDYKSRSFKLWDPADTAEFNLVMDRIVNGWYVQHKRYDNWVQEHLEYIVRLEWIQIYGESPNTKAPGSGFDGQNQTITLDRPAVPDRPEAPTGPWLSNATGQLRQLLAQPMAPMGSPGTPY